VNGLLLFRLLDLIEYLDHFAHPLVYEAKVVNEWLVVRHLAHRFCQLDNEVFA
jgi:hypothetical protein